MELDRRDAEDGMARGPAARTLPVVLALIVLALVLPQRLEAQYEKPPPAAAYGLEDVTVLRADGSTLEGVNVVVRAGRIAALGSDVEIPAGARLLEGDSLRIYPGMIDAAGGAEYELPEPDSSPGEVASWSPPRDVQRFRPHVRVADHLTSDGGSVSDQRQQGIVAAAVHPEEGPAPGRSALLLLRDGATTGDLILDPELGGVLSLQASPGVYPGTLFGVMAFHRQQFRNAAHYSSVAAAYEESPAGLRPPAWDADHEVLSSMAAGRTQVYFRAEGAENIRRALDVADRVGFEPVIVGGRGAGQVADLLADREVPVLLSTDYPTPQRWDPDAEEPVREDTLPPEVQREKRRVEDAYRDAALLHEAGVTLALTTGDGEATLREGARRAIEYGLPESAALRAVTSVPAGIVGRPELASVREGVSANFVVSDGPLFDEETELLYTFVDGRPEVMYDPGSEPSEPPTVDVTGTWEVEIESEQGSFEGTMELEQEGSDVSGSFSSSGQGPPLSVEGGTVSGNKLSLTLTASAGGETIELILDGTVEGEEASGTGSGPFGSFTWEATHTSTPDRGAE